MPSRRSSVSGARLEPLFKPPPEQQPLAAPMRPRGLHGCVSVVGSAAIPVSFRSNHRLRHRLHDCSDDAMLLHARPFGRRVGCQLLLAGRQSGRHRLIATQADGESC